MYSNNKKNGFSILDLLVKIIFAGLFIFILVWLFQKKVPNMKPFYSNVFRENIKYMQEAGESYFTTDKLPATEGEEIKLTLSRMIDEKLILPFVDEDGNSCDEHNSYVSITKTQTGYNLKTNLVCNKESDFTIKILGCHDFCENDECNKCYVEEIVQYQYKKLINGTKTVYSCPKGYKLNGKYCYMTNTSKINISKESKTSTKVVSEEANIVIDKNSVTVDATKKETTNTRDFDVSTNVTTKSADVSYSCPSGYQNLGTTCKKVSTTTKSADVSYSCPSGYTKSGTTCTKTTTDTKTATATTTYSCPSGYTKSGTTCTKTTTSTKDATKESYDCSNQVPTTVCKDVSTQEPYSCNCSTKFVGGVLKTSCNTCYKTVVKQECSTVNVSDNKVCYRYVCPSGYTQNQTTCTKTTTDTKTATATTTYSCPSGYTKSGTTCTKTTTSTKDATVSYSCPSGYDRNDTVCTKTTTNIIDSTKSYSCPSGYTKSGTTCTKTTYTYSCPDGYTKTSSNCVKKSYSYVCPSGYGLSGTKCYKDGYHYECKSGYKLNGSVCTKTITETSTTDKCPDGYTKGNGVCTKTVTDKVAATSTKTNNSYYSYKWSEKDTLKGYTKTGKTRTVKGKEICK